MERKKVIVTGGTGFIGSHTVVSLLEQGFEVVIVDNLINSSLDVLDGIEKIAGSRPDFFELDMQDSTRTAEFFATQTDAVAVIHFAALKAVGESMKKPLMYYRNNLFSMVNLLESMTRHGIFNLIFSSSCTVYGDPDVVPIRESNEVKPALSPYGNTKKVCEDMIQNLGRSEEGFHAISLRYFNPIGAHDSVEIGELPIGVPNNLLPYITQTAAGLREELLVFGGDYDTPDGTAVRDYIHVMDVADAHVKALNRLLSGTQKKRLEVFNLGTGKGSSVLEVIQSFEKMSGCKVPFRIVGRREGDVPEVYAATDLANQELGWQAKRSLDDMTASSWRWECRVRQLEV